MGNGQVIENAAFAVGNGQFTSVGMAGEVAVPSGAKRVDLTGMTVIPAIVDAHTHLGTTREALIEDLRRRAYHGVGAAMSLGHDGEGVPLGVRNEVTPGAARYRSAGRGITTPEPGRSEVPHWVTTEEEARQAVRDEAARNVDIIKIWVDDRNGQYEKLGPELYGAIIDEAHQNGVRVTAHIFALEDAKSLLRAGIDAFAHGVPRPGRRRRVRGARQRTAECRAGAEHAQSRRADGPCVVERLDAGRGACGDAGCGYRAAGGSSVVRHPGTQSGEAQRGGHADRLWHRRQQALGPHTSRWRTWWRPG